MITVEKTTWDFATMAMDAAAGRGRDNTRFYTGCVWGVVHIALNSHVTTRLAVADLYAMAALDLATDDHGRLVQTISNLEMVINQLAEEES